MIFKRRWMSIIKDVRSTVKHVRYTVVTCPLEENIKIRQRIIHLTIPYFTDRLTFATSFPAVLFIAASTNNHKYVKSIIRCFSFLHCTNVLKLWFPCDMKNYTWKSLNAIDCKIYIHLVIKATSEGCFAFNAHQMNRNCQWVKLDNTENYGVVLLYHAQNFSCYQTPHSWPPQAYCVSSNLAIYSTLVLSSLCSIVGTGPDYDNSYDGGKAMKTTNVMIKQHHESGVVKQDIHTSNHFNDIACLHQAIAHNNAFIPSA